MERWTDFLMNPQAISAIYGEDVPSLNSINLHFIKLHHDGPTAKLGFRFKDFPTNPPKKWLKEECNRVQISLTLIQLSDTNIKKWSINNLIDLKIERLSNRLLISTSGDRCDFQLRCTHLLLENISAYKDILSDWNYGDMIRIA